MIKRTLFVLTLPLLALTACDTSSKSPFECNGTIPGADDFDEVEFMAWVDRNGPVNFENNFWYSISEGTTIGWSLEEDSEICISPWSR